MKKAILACAAVVCLVAEPAKAQTLSYMPLGPQQNVALSTILDGGWTQCYAAPLGTFIGTYAENILSQCHGDNLMMAGRLTGSDMFLLLAAGNLGDVTTNTGSGASATTHIVNGSQWYFSPDWSWGFAPIGETVRQNECDVTFPGPEHMCLHTVNGAGGYRIGDFANNGSTDYEKVIFVGGDVVATPEPASLVLLATGLIGLFGVARGRRREADSI